MTENITEELERNLRTQYQLQKSGKMLKKTEENHNKRIRN